MVLVGVGKGMRWVHAVRRALGQRSCGKCWFGTCGVCHTLRNWERNLPTEEILARAAEALKDPAIQEELRKLNVPR